MKKLFTFLLLSLFTLTAHAANFNKVLVIVFENTEYNNAIKQPYFASLVKQGALLSNFQATSVAIAVAHQLKRTMLQIIARFIA